MQDFDLTLRELTVGDARGKAARGESPKFLEFIP